MELTIEKIQEYKKIKEFLDDVCEKYFNSIAPDWKCYSGWKFSDDYPNCIIAVYGYYDYRDNYEIGDVIAPFDVLIEFSKRYDTQ